MPEMEIKPGAVKITRVRREDMPLEQRQAWDGFWLMIAHRALAAMERQTTDASYGLNDARGVSACERDAEIEAGERTAIAV
jgi:hypothetical protein